ncbi:hypothetical protein KC19_2G196600 [Ceratodon purpureus]|uniref:Mitochondrial glycoprotein n=1 Tax=Ceratodon purpureus TaxID=3225 RepID=A0A8T0IYQ8_CERPU|nr:hypothetical protein KC19_2G196600 [Ceratodon purpureus]
MMQASVRAASWIIARTGKKGIESAGLQRVGRLIPGGMSRGSSQLVTRQWLCGHGSQLALLKSFSASAHMCGSVTGGGIDECEVVQGLREEVRRLKAANVVRVVEPPEPFVLREKPGCMDVILQREFDHENINVECELLIHPQDVSDEDDNVHNDSVKVPYALLINLRITITKDGSEALEISCQCHGDEYFINYISYHENISEVGHDHAVHEKQLSEDLKREFIFYLFLRGFDDEMAVFLHQYFEKKRNEERITNFEKVAAILAEN